MNILEKQGYEALDVLADLMQPCVDIMSDTELADLFKQRETVKAVAKMLKQHKEPVVQVISIVKENTVEDVLKMNILDLTADLIRIINDPIVQQLFMLQNQNADVTSFGSAMVNATAE